MRDLHSYYNFALVLISRYLKKIHSFPANQKCVMFSCILLQNELDNTNSCYQLFMTIAISGKKNTFWSLFEKISMVEALSDYNSKE